MRFKKWFIEQAVATAPVGGKFQAGEQIADRFYQKVGVAVRSDASGTVVKFDDGFEREYDKEAEGRYLYQFKSWKKTPLNVQNNVIDTSQTAKESKIVFLDQGLEGKIKAFNNSNSIKDANLMPSEDR